MKKPYTTVEREKRHRKATLENFTYKAKLALFALGYLITGIAILAVVCWAVYAAWQYMPRVWYFYALLTASAWVLAPVLMNAGRGFLKDGIVQVLKELALAEMAKKEKE